MSDVKTNAPRVTPEQIGALMDRVFYSVDLRPSGSTSTLVHAFLDGKFYLASGHSACVSPENFNAEQGVKSAKDKARRGAEDKLWELEGYALFKRLREPSVFTVKGDFSDDDLAKFRTHWESRVKIAPGGTLEIARDGHVTITADSVTVSGEVKYGEDGPLLAVPAPSFTDSITEPLSAGFCG
jgi:hypothetical protein